MDNQKIVQSLTNNPVVARGLLGIVNNTDLKTTCLKCGSNDIQEPIFSTEVQEGHKPYDWQCVDCGTYQLNYIKSRKFRLYAFLLSGSWTSRNFYARSLKEAYKIAVRQYGDLVLQSYLVGGVDSYVLKGWLHFNKE